MPWIDTDMNIFGDDGSASRASNDRETDEKEDEETRRHREEWVLDSNIRTATTKTTEENNNDAQGIIQDKAYDYAAVTQQAVGDLAKMRRVLDHVFQLRLEAAATLDAFAMLAEPGGVTEETDASDADTTHAES